MLLSSSPPSSSESAGRAQGRVARPADSSAIAIDDVAVESYSGVRSDSVVVVVDRNNMLQSSSSFSHDSASFRYGGTTGGSGNVGEGGVHDWSIGSGLDEATLESFPKFCYSRQLGKLYISGDGDDDRGGDQSEGSCKIMREIVNFLRGTLYNKTESMKRTEAVAAAAASKSKKAEPFVFERFKRSYSLPSRLQTA